MAGVSAVQIIAAIAIILGLVALFAAQGNTTIELGGAGAFVGGIIVFALSKR